MRMKTTLLALAMFAVFAPSKPSLKPVPVPVCDPGDTACIQCKMQHVGCPVGQ